MSSGNRARPGPIRRWWDLHLSIVDPIAGGVAGAAAAWAVVARDCSWSTDFVHHRAGDFFIACATVSGALLGLLDAALAVLADHLGRPEVGGRLKAGHREALVSVFARTMFWLGTATLIAVSALVPSGTRVLQTLLAMLMVAIGISVVMLARAISLPRAVVRAAINTRTPE